MGRPETCEVDQERVAPEVAAFSLTSASPVPLAPTAGIPIRLRDDTRYFPEETMALPLPEKSVLMTAAPEEAAAVTVRATVVECVREPLVAVTVSVLEPAGVEELVLTVSVDEPGVAKLLAEKEAVEPEGKPETESVTGLVKPAMAVVESA